MEKGKNQVETKIILFKYFAKEYFEICLIDNLIAINKRRIYETKSCKH